MTEAKPTPREKIERLMHRAVVVPAKQNGVDRDPFAVLFSDVHTADAFLLLHTSRQIFIEFLTLPTKVLDTRAGIA